MNKFLGFLMVAALSLPLALPDREKAPATAPMASLTKKVQPAAGVRPVAETLNELVKSEIVVEKAGDRQARCLAQAVYFEARSESLEGQLAVAQVVLNRVADKRYPNTICAVVFQNENRRHRCQFSFACDGRSDTPFEARAWDVAQRIGYVALEGLWQDVTGDATHYHASYSKPYWRTHMIATAHYGHHMFYRDAAM